jgi:hypothetical protein
MGGGVASSATNAEDDGGLQLGCRFRYHNADGGGAVHCRATRRSRSSTRQAPARCQWSLLWLLDPRDRHTRQALAVLDLHAGHQRSGPAVIARLLFIEVTSATDGLSHRVSQQMYDACLAEGSGRYLALCGRTVPAAALITQPGPVCRLCLEVVRAQQPT